MQWSRRVRPGLVALAGLSVVTVVLLALAIQRASAPPPRYDPPTAGSGAPSVAFIGNSFTSGTPTGGLGDANYTQLLGTRFGWAVTNTAADGAGYVAGPAFREAQLPRVLAARPSLVVVQGSRTDADRPPADVRDAAARLYAEILQGLPGVRIVVIGPLWPLQDAPDRVLETRDAVRDAATTVQLPFLDPIEDRWFDGAEEGLVGADDEHLTDAGHRKMADLVGEGLRRIGVAPR